MHRYAHVDSMRALAAVLVVMTHAAEFGHFGIPGARASGDWFYHLSYGVDFGRIGVVLFFAISGFVIPGSLRGGQHAGSFWVRRFFRLYPLFWFSVPLALTTHWWLPGNPIGVAGVAANLTMIPEAFGAPYVQAVYWTLAVELVFYVLCHALFLAGANENRYVLAAAAAVFAAIYYIYRNAGLSPRLGEFWGLTFGHLSIMFFGALCRLEYEKHCRFLGSAISALALFWLVVYPLSGWFALQTAHNGVETVRLFAPYPVAIALFLILLFRAKLRFGPAVWLGRISYSLYLLHDVVIYALGSLLAAFVPWSVPGIVGYTALCLLAATLISALTYRWIEQPMQTIGSRFAGRLDRRETRGAVAALGGEAV